jgi:hypothetical protein
VDLQEGLDLSEKLHCSIIWVKIEITALRSPVVAVAKFADYQSLIKDHLLIMSFFANEINRVLL